MMNLKRIYLSTITLSLSMVSFAVDPQQTEILPTVAESERMTIRNDIILNDEASIPPQCYTMTESQYNPCYSCHQLYDRRGEPRFNQLDDGALQGNYEFSDIGASNHWQNLFVDKQAWLEKISDSAIQKYVDQDNYSPLAGRLTKAKWQGFIPDLENLALANLAFDEHGLALDGSGWVAFNYKPFLGTFWPTNGSTDDVIIRLPKAFRELDGQFNRDIYYTNLSLLELTIKNEPSQSIWALDENAIQVDIDQDGQLSTANKVLKRSHYVGDAKDVPVIFQQFPTDSEIMHSVRYVGVDAQEQIIVPKRMKELRYMKKLQALPASTIESRYAKERKEKLEEELPSFINLGDSGLDNGLGWAIQGFIEDYSGDLRPQSYEETMFCMGCHSAIGTTIDSTFSLARKVSGADGWGYIDLHEMPDAPNVSEENGEIFNYLRRVHGGSEFRENPEMQQKWFLANGELDAEKVKSADVYQLITPSKERALALNKAYSYIVRHQSYIQGRDANWLAAKNVYKEINQEITPLNAEHRVYHWDIRLDWSN